MHKIMPDDHYLYQERPGIWVAASELTPTERFRLRLAGKTFHVQTEVQNDDKLTEISQLLSQYQDMREYLEVLNYAKDVVESALPGNVTGRQAMHLVRAPFVASGPETHEAYLNHRRRKRDNTYGDQSTAQALFYQDFGSACGANDQETTIFNIVPCLIVSVSQVNYGLSIQQNEFNKLLTLFGLQVRALAVHLQMHPFHPLKFMFFSPSNRSTSMETSSPRPTASLPWCRASRPS